MQHIDSTIRSAARAACFAVLAVVLASASWPASAQQDPRCQIARTIIGSLIRGGKAPPCNSPNATANSPDGIKPQGSGTLSDGISQPSGKGIDTPANVERVRQ